VKKNHYRIYLFEIFFLIVAFVFVCMYMETGSHEILNETANVKNARARGMPTRRCATRARCGLLRNDDQSCICPQT